jgi:hypothetical protein
MRETGFDSLKSVGKIPDDVTQVKIDSYEELMDPQDGLPGAEPGSWNVLDSLSGFEALLRDYVLRTEFDGVKKQFDAYSQGTRKNVPRHADLFLSTCVRLRQKGVNILMIAHEATETIRNPQGEDYIRSGLALDEGDRGTGIRPMFMKAVQAVLWMTLPTQVTQGKAEEASSRFLYTSLSLTHQAKNSLNLPPIINLGSSEKIAFDNFTSKLPEIYVPKTN